MAKLSFYGVADRRVSHPHGPYGDAYSAHGGQSPKWVGYEYDETKKDHVPSDKADSFEDDGSVQVEKVKRDVRNEYRDFGSLCLKPADEYTAKACGVPFERLPTPARSSKQTHSAQDGE